MKKWMISAVDNIKTYYKGTNSWAKSMMFIIFVNVICIFGAGHIIGKDNINPPEVGKSTQISLEPCREYSRYAENAVGSLQHGVPLTKAIPDTDLTSGNIHRIKIYTDVYDIMDFPVRMHRNDTNEELRQSREDYGNVIFLNCVSMKVHEMNNIL